MRTNDIVFAGFLLAKGIELVTIEVEERKGTFVFPPIDDEIENKFYAGLTVIEPVTLHNNIKRLTTAVRKKYTNER